MRFEALPLVGAHLIHQEPRSDDRGFFARAFCSREFAAAGLQSEFVQANNTLTAKQGVMRGFHYQLPPAAEVKLVRCIRGAVHDVIVDIRPHSPTFKQWYGARLDAENRTMMYVPHGFAHGFITLTEDAELHYMVSAFYDQPSERGLRHDDPAIGVTWPIPVVETSQKDGAWPSLDHAFHGLDLLAQLPLKGA